MVRTLTFAAMAFALVSVNVANATLIVTAEAAGVQSSSATDIYTIDFDSVSKTGYHGKDVFVVSPTLTATYDGTHFIDPAGQYGGAGGAGQYLSVQATQSFDLKLSESQAYFGLWFSAADFANKIQFYNGATLVGSYSGGNPPISTLPADYLGNPNTAVPRANSSEPYVYLNFYAITASDMFDKIVFSNLPGPTEFESDNHSFSTTLQAPVPEPSTFALTAVALAGFGCLKLRKRVVA